MMPDIEEFTKFHKKLTCRAPKDYHPSYIPLQKHSKVPVLGVSWKDQDYRLSFRQAVKHLLTGGNIGIVGRYADHLVNVDLDGDEVRKNVLVPTLTTRSRSRTGVHGFYWGDKKEIPNIATDNQGEVRAGNQYVVCAGSYVPVDDVEAIPEQWRDRAGYYTVEDAQPPAWITFDDLPQFFKDQYNKALEQQKENEEKRKNQQPRKANGKRSALFDITAYDVVLREGGETEPNKRWGSIFHDSKTEANMSISRDGRYLHCWRHGVYHNGLSCLTVLSGYKTCMEAGAPHKGTVGSSGVDDGAIFHAWLYAKTHNYIPADDPIPVRALNHIAEKHLGYKVKPHERLPWTIYLTTLKILEELY